MSNYYTSANALEDKLAEILAEKNLLHVMDKSRYPITLTVTQNQSPEAQMELFYTTDGSMSSRDSILRLVFDIDGLEIQTNNRLVIDEKFMNKIKNQAKKIHAAYVHAFFASTISSLRTVKEEKKVENETADNSQFAGFYEEKDPAAEGEEE